MNTEKTPPPDGLAEASCSAFATAQDPKWKPQFGDSADRALASILDATNAAHGTTRREAANNVIYLFATLAARVAELEATNSKFCNAVAIWALEYDDALDDCDKEAKKWKAQGDMYGWNFHQGMRSGWIGNDIALSKLKDLAHEYTGRELERPVANKPNPKLSHDALYHAQE